MSEIIQVDNKILRQVAKEIPTKDIGSEKIKKLISKMEQALKKEKDGVALAGPQIAESWRIFIISPIAYDTVQFLGDRKYVFINPKIIKKSNDKKLMEEGCLSVRPYYGKVRRSSKATVRAYDENGQEFEMEGAGLIAQIFQHEIDHLDGILFIDKAKDVREIPKEIYEQK
ncbi:MAG TPA: peptide deformylase [Candidatus Paceibacterota bacterium]|nr:peptide deformylase [Candidatus Paceibacterota bacterium]HMP18870.1 peptide deformylase [Candidatus Paceibacterota bacterium]HMP85166.1 peptide deformylase [Candidatus Paceibacterota bacterium]